MSKQYTAKDLNLSIKPETLKELYKISPYRHALAIVMDWLVILGVIYLCINYFNPLCYLIAVIIIGARMHALAILMHDATHYRFLKNRTWNDLITNVVTMYPLFTTISNYRQNHLRHHQNLNTEDDPDWAAKLTNRAYTFPKTKRVFLLGVMSYLFLYQGFLDALWLFKRLNMAEKKPEQKKESKLGQLIFFAVLFTVLTLLGWWKYYLIFWVVPYLSSFFMFQYIRSVAEHFGDLAYDHLLTSTRTVKTNFLEEFFIAPHNVGYHLEHHLYPGVPFYNLAKLHRALMEDTEYYEKAHITEGYLQGLFNELGKTKATA